MRVGFTLIGGAGWTGGVNYLENLLSAISEHPSCGVEPVLFIGPDVEPEVVSRLQPFLVTSPIRSVVWGGARWVRLMRLFLAVFLQRDLLAEHQFRKARVDVVLQHGVWYGCLFRVPTIAWIADFQHHHLPHMFSRFNRYWRTLGYWGLGFSATRIMVSSHDAKNDCERFYPRSRGKVDAVPFAVRLKGGDDADLELVRECYQLPERFFYLPNQFWMHKNHLNLVRALGIAKRSGDEVMVVASGNLADGRNPWYPQSVLDTVSELQLERNFIFLGLIPYRHILPLMRLSSAVLNPSLFEGWSTTVEEAKAVGAPLLLSDLNIHREQAAGIASFYAPEEPQHIATVLAQAWRSCGAGPRPEAERIAWSRNKRDRGVFAMNFGAVVERAYDASL